MNASEFTRNLISEANFITDEIRHIASSLNDEQLNRKPSSDKWSIGQVIDHINKSNRFYLRELERILIDGKLKPSANKRVKPGILGSFALNAIEPGNKKKYKSHELFQPDAHELNGKTLLEFIEIQNLLSQYLEMLAAFDLSSAKVSSPANRLIRFRVGDFLSLIITHEKRHLLQIKSISDAAGFVDAK